jgi:hypothetical protein
MNRLDDWLSSLNAPIYVTGNGPLRLPPSDVGSIVRFNNFELSERAGWRVTHWVTCAWDNVKDRPLANPLSPWTSDWKSANRSGRFIETTGKNPVFTENNDHVLKWFPDAYQDPVNTWPSTGFCFLALLDHYGIKGLTVDGFNGLKDGHYWDPGHKHDHQSTADRELRIISSGFTRHP